MKGQFNERTSLYDNFNECAILTNCGIDHQGHEIDGKNFIGSTEIDPSQFTELTL